MALRFREYWFEWGLFSIVFLFFIFMAIVFIAPHRDDEMRGFSRCSFMMSLEVSEAAEERQILAVSKAVGRGYLCYAEEIFKGFRLWQEGKQKTPWENYLFKPKIEAEDIQTEPLSRSLLRANLFDDDGEASDFLSNDVKENEND